MKFQWQLILNAPRDGQVILLTEIIDNLYHFIGMGYWDDQRKRWCRIDSLQVTECRSTHWHPLPRIPIK